MLSVGTQGFRLVCRDFRIYAGWLLVCRVVSHLRYVQMLGLSCWCTVMICWCAEVTCWGAEVFTAVNLQSELLICRCPDICPAVAQEYPVVGHRCCAEVSCCCAERSCSCRGVLLMCLTVRVVQLSCCCAVVLLLCRVALLLCSCPAVVQS